jgi:thiamine-monophosphate kinase
MLIKDSGGEFSLIQKIKRKAVNTSVITGIGDDCAVFKTSGTEQIITKDILVEGDHFSNAYFTPYQIGLKAAHSNLSDIASMGGKPLYALIGLVLTSKTTVSWVKEFYKGFYSTCSKYSYDVIGGDTTHGKIHMISVTLVGEKHLHPLRYRHGAQAGDIIRTTGPLGASFAGYLLFKKGIKNHPYPKKKHTNPTCRLDISDSIAEYATSMQDISDGLASEVKHITKASNTGAVLFKENIPVKKQTFAAAESLKKDAYDFALYGGEDFELVYTINPKYEHKVPGITVGEITKEKKVYLKDNDTLAEITKSGYDHFT